MVWMWNLSHKYIIGYYNPSVRITVKLLTLLMLCVLILYMNGGTDFDFERETFHGGFGQKSADRLWSKKYFHLDV